MPPKNASERLTSAVGKPLGASVQVKCYGGGAKSKCFADYVDFYLDDKLFKEGKIAPIEYSQYGRNLMEYYFSFVVPFKTTISSIDNKLTKRIVHFDLEKHSVKIVFYYRGVEVETKAYSTTFFPEKVEIKKGFDPTVEEFLSSVGGQGLVFIPDDSNLKKAFKAVGP